MWNTLKKIIQDFFAKFNSFLEKFNIVADWDTIFKVLDETPEEE